MNFISLFASILHELNNFLFSPGNIISLVIVGMGKGSKIKTFEVLSEPNEK